MLQSKIAQAVSANLDIKHLPLRNLYKKLHSLDGYNQPIYRFFREKEHAEALCRGEVWLSTLEKCRTYEDPLQGDREEAIHTYKSGTVIGNGDDPKVIEVAKRSGLGLRECDGSVFMTDNTYIQHIDDAYVICTTLEYEPEKFAKSFGTYCVKITNPEMFFKSISACLNKKSKIIEAEMGKVTYECRRTSGLEPQPSAPVGFVKPTQYSPQKEFRFLWRVNKFFGSDDKHILQCPEASQYCEMMESPK